FPAPWSVYAWLDGDPATGATVTDWDRLAADLGGFLLALERAPTDGAPAPGPENFHRGGPLAAYDRQTRTGIADLAGVIDVARAVEVWQTALAAVWTGPAVWVHGDIPGSNLLVRGGSLCAVIDFGCAAIGDPACDLTPAWTMFDHTS